MKSKKREYKITKVIIQTVLCLAIVPIFGRMLWIKSASAQALCTENLQEIRNGSSPQYGSGWIDIVDTTFRTGDKLTLEIGGTAEKIIIRLLPSNRTPDESAGIISGTQGVIFQVPENRVIEVTLQKDHPDVKQISVHGGSKVWNYDLGKNGPAWLNSVSCK